MADENRRSELVEYTIDDVDCVGDPGAKPARACDQNLFGSLVGRFQLNPGGMSAAAGSLARRVFRDKLRGSGLMLPVRGNILEFHEFAQPAGGPEAVR